LKTEFRLAKNINYVNRKSHLIRAAFAKTMFKVFSSIKNEVKTLLVVVSGSG